MSYTTYLGLAGSLVLAAALPACTGAAAPPPPKQASAELQTPTAPGASTFEARWPVLEGFALDTVRSRNARLHVRLNVAKEIRERCALPDVYFDFDSTAISAEDRQQIARLARCFTTGPLRDRRLTLIGRADLTGDPTYNMGLGMRRAAHLKALLVQDGVAPARVSTISRGATATLGTFEGYTYADDRRVDILISQ